MSVKNEGKTLTKLASIYMDENGEIILKEEPGAMEIEMFKKSGTEASRKIYYTSIALVSAIVDSPLGERGRDLMVKGVSDMLKTGVRIAGLRKELDGMIEEIASEKDDDLEDDDECEWEDTCDGCEKDESPSFVCKECEGCKHGKYEKSVEVRLGDDVTKDDLKLLMKTLKEAIKDD